MAKTKTKPPAQDGQLTPEEIANLSDEERRKILIATCVGLGVARVVVPFDGCGDSGQVDDPCLYDGVGKEVKIPPGVVAPVAELVSKGIDKTGSWVDNYEFSYKPLNEALKDFTYDVLDKHCPGDWVNNEGGYGELVMDLSIPYKFHLEYHQRIETTEDYDIDLFEDEDGEVSAGGGLRHEIGGKE